MMKLNNTKKKIRFCLVVALFLFQYSFASTYYVSTAGNDSSGDGSALNPWKTLMYAVTKVAANQGHTIQVGAGTFVENGLVEVPLGVNVTGAGIDVTIFKAASSFYYHPSGDPGYSTNKFLISLSQVNPTDGNQTLSNFTIDGDSKQLHGGIYVRYRNKVVINAVKVQNTNYTGIWLWDVQDSQLTSSQLINCSWGSTGYCTGSLNLGNLQRVEISQLNVNENTGYGVKAIGPDGYNDIFNLKIHDSHVSVSPFGLWNNGSAPNIAIELWMATLVTCEIYNTYVDNTISLVNSAVPSTGVQTIRVHDNTLDMITRANGAGYGLELTIHDAEVDHNYFLAGSYGIANWGNPMKNWAIHHNTFYALSGIYPGEVVRSQWSGLHNLKLYNNTIEFTGTQTMNVVGLYGGSSDSLDIKNNLVINSNTAYNYYPNQLIHSEGGAVIGSHLQVLSNSTANLAPGDVLTSILSLLVQNPLVNLAALTNPSITKTGNRPSPYYMPAAGSSLIDAGINVGYSFLGSAPDIGAFEYGASSASPQVSLTSPLNNASFTAGASVAIVANATETGGTISKVDFYQGATKLGTVTASPYTYVWGNVAAGSYSLTAIATDTQNITTTSAPIIIVVNPKVVPVVALTSPVNNSTFAAGSTITITAGASETGGAVSKVDFYQGTNKLGTASTSPYSYSWASVAAGSYSLTAVATDNQNATTTSAAIAIIVSSTNAAPVVSITSPANNAIFKTGSTVTIKATATDPDGAVAKVEFFQGTTKLGEDLASPYSFAWSGVSAGIYSLTARATDNLGAATTSKAITIKIDIAPVVSITSPASNASFASGSSISITANATDSDGTISKVEFFQGATKLGETLASPYTFKWANVPAGSYSLTAKATDNLNTKTSSATVSITVLSANVAPIVSITSPANNASFTTGATITIGASAADSDGTISKVEFFQGTTKLGESTAAPYSFAWANVPAGNYTLTAKATDNGGASTVSTAVGIAVSDPVTTFQLGLLSTDAVLSGGMTLMSDATSSSGSYFSMPTGSGANYYIPPPASATFNFQLPKTDTYFVWARVKSPTASNQGYYIYDGRGNWSNWVAGIHTQWAWVKLSDSSTGAISTFAFSQGLNEFQMAWNDENVQIDRILITNDATLVPAEPVIASQIAVFPNPIVDTFTIQYTSPIDQSAQVSIFDQNGTLIMQTMVMAYAGVNNIVLGTTNIYNGTYILVFTPTVSGGAGTTRIVIYR